jgi:hypothetical protein
MTGDIQIDLQDSGIPIWTMPSQPSARRSATVSVNTAAVLP